MVTQAYRHSHLEVVGFARRLAKQSDPRCHRPWHAVNRLGRTVCRQAVHDTWERRDAGDPPPESDDRCATCFDARMAYIRVGTLVGDPTGRFEREGRRE